MDCAPEHEAQDVWQSEHTAAPSVRVAGKVPSVGQTLTQVVSWRKDAPGHARHSLAAGPVHWEHEGSHAAQMLPFAHLPSAVQSETHRPLAAPSQPVLPAPLEMSIEPPDSSAGGAAKGNAAAHAVHSSLPRPTQVAQLAWHAAHTSATLALPPAHAKPASTAVQSPAHPSPSTVLESSQLSAPARSPSPHLVTHESGPLSEPPLHT
jgi:hypothetical protein